MNVPRRILEGGSGDWERQIVESAKSDAPSPQFRRRITTEVGLLASAAGLTGATQAWGQTLGVLGLLKLLGVGAAIGVATVGASYAVNRASTSERHGSPVTTIPRKASASSGKGSVDPRAAARPTTPAPEAFTAPSVPEPLSQPLVTAERSSVRKQPQPPSEGASAKTAPGPAKAPPAASSFALDSALSAELRAIERVRTALAGGNPRAALDALDRYESSPDAKLFRLEAEVLRIEAFVQLGDAKRARDLGQRFLSEHPASPYEWRVRSLMGENP